MLAEQIPVSAARASAYEGNAAEWNALVETDEASSFCHLAEWASIMEDVLGHRSLFVLARDASGAAIGALPLVRVTGPFAGHKLVSMPFLNYGGPIGSAAARAPLTSFAIETARRSGAASLELRTRGAAEAGMAVASRKVAVLLPLPAAADELWKRGLTSKLRSQIRRPQREDMVTRFGLGEIGAFYEVFARNMRDLGTPVLPFGFFEAIARHFADRVMIGVVYHGETPVAAGWGFTWRDEFEITWASSLREYARSAPNMLLYWSFMERCIQRGVRVFNFGRCTPDGGTHRFKLQWGGETIALPWSVWSRNGSTSSGHDGALLQFASRCWQHMPLGVANRVGPVLARRLP